MSFKHWEFSIVCMYSVDVTNTHHFILHFFEIIILEVTEMIPKRSFFLQTLSSLGPLLPPNISDTAKEKALMLAAERTMTPVSSASTRSKKKKGLVKFLPYHMELKS